MNEKLRGYALITRWIQFSLDLLILAGSFQLAYLLRFDFRVPQGILATASAQMPVVILIQVVALFLAGVYSFIWRYIGMRELNAFVLAFWWSAFALAVLRFTLSDTLAEWRVPLAVILMDSVLGSWGSSACGS